MMPSTRAELDRRLRINEGCVLTPYYDTAKPPRLTIAVGFNLQRTAPWVVAHNLAAAGITCPPSLDAFKALVITQAQADRLLDNDVPMYIANARALLAPGVFDTMTPARQIAFVDFVYNEGGGDFPGTEYILSTAQRYKNSGDPRAHAMFALAGDHLRLSDWYGQVGNRAKRNVAMLVTGKLCDANGDGSDVI